MELYSLLVLERLPKLRLLMEMASDATVHTKKSGIKKVILSSDSPHRDQYLTLL